MLSRDFYRAMEAGELSDLDDGEEPGFHDFLKWHGLYKIWLKANRVIVSRSTGNPSWSNSVICRPRRECAMLTRSDYELLVYTCHRAIRPSVSAR